MKFFNRQKARTLATVTNNYGTHPLPDSLGQEAFAAMGKLVVTLRGDLRYDASVYSKEEFDKLMERIELAEKAHDALASLLRNIYGEDAWRMADMFSVGVGSR